MALDLNHGVHFIRGGTEYFYGSYTHAVSPALAFSVGGVTRYVPFTSGGGYLKLQKNGTTYGVTSPSATVTVTCTFTSSPINRRWTACSVSISNNGFVEASTVTVKAKAMGVSLSSKSYAINANTTSGGSTFSTTVMNIDSIELTVTVFNKTYTATASVGISTTSVTCSVTVS